MDKLKFVKEQMLSIGIPYAFLEWNKPIQYPYYVGELPSGGSTPTEDGYEENTLLVTGFQRGPALALEQDKERIRKHFHPITGCCGKTDSGCIAVFFDGAFYVPTGEADLKKMQINLKIKEWKVT